MLRNFKMIVDGFTFRVDRFDLTLVPGIAVYEVCTYLHDKETGKDASFGARLMFADAGVPDDAYLYGRVFKLLEFQYERIKNMPYLEPSSFVKEEVRSGSSN